ncbi:MAG TPA: STAS domain-containing protein [Jatrophihabitantaceae bacterium]|jgi:anti-anti-sigma regulatory factor|nr:STAS domain-containing protein [Jatrophihabitantaceae bacterium]
MTSALAQRDGLFEIDVCAPDDPRLGELRARGVLNSAGADMLGAVLTAQRELGVQYVRLDVCQVTAIDEVAVAALLRAHQCFLASRGTLVLTGVCGPVRDALAAAGLDSVLLTVGPTADARLS